MVWLSAYDYNRLAFGRNFIKIVGRNVLSGLDALMIKGIRNEIESFMEAVSLGLDATIEAGHDEVIGVSVDNGGLGGKRKSVHVAIADFDGFVLAQAKTSN